MTGRLVAVVGPTAAGKTALAIRIAEALGGEIVSTDSQQVYRGMDIGTGKATLQERAAVPHHLLDIVDPDEPMTAARLIALADQAIAGILARGRAVVTCGGTGLYYRALIHGLFEGPGAEPELRARLEAEAETHGTETLWARLSAVDPEAARKIDRRDRVRTIRALEVYELTGVPISQHQRAHDFKTVPPRYDVLGIGLSPGRDELHRRIDARVDQMIEMGLVEEVRGLIARGYSPGLRAFSAIGYREICAFLQGGVSRADAVLKIKQASRRYARRQLTWFRSEPTVTWYKSPADVDLGRVIAWWKQPGRA
ncbi:MAG: tRNA (adenosine(37)-N6)-dimethylallyltransferase MiaA [Deltaproteobacteria bacterium]|nr:tRNA (adenosine(37)-N6)-dimethylallyltransferase MiaA [Deltaproteobacteria bacterium]